VDTIVIKVMDYPSPPYLIMLPIKIIGRPNGRTKEFKFKTSD